MNRSRLLGVASLALLAGIWSGPASAQQQDWRPSSSSGGQTAYIDAASIQREGDKVRFWREVRSASPRTFQGGERYDRLGARVEVDCRARTMSSLEVYAKLGDRVIGGGAASGRVDPIEAGSTADSDMRAVCFNDWPN